MLLKPLFSGSISPETFCPTLAQVESAAKRQEAYDLLAPVYGWFTEGFDTADLKEAKMLLDEPA